MDLFMVELAANLPTMGRSPVWLAVKVANQFSLVLIDGYYLKVDLFKVGIFVESFHS